MNIFLILQLAFAVLMLAMYITQWIYYFKTKDWGRSMLFYIAGVLCFSISVIFSLFQK